MAGRERRTGGDAERCRAPSRTLLVVAAALLAPSALLNASDRPSTAALVVAGAATAGALAALTAWTLRTLVPPGVATRVRDLLDVAAAALLVPALAIAVLLRPLEAASSLSTAEAAVMVVAPALAVVALGLVVVPLHLYRGTGALPAVLLVTVVATVMLTWTTGAASAAALVGPSAPGRAALAAGAVLATASVVGLLLVRPSRPPACEPRDDAVMYGRVAQLLIVAALLALDHAVALPTGAVVLALGSMGVQLVTIAVVHTQLDSLTARARRAGTDDLTGLGNRRVLTEALAEVDAGRPLALVLLDLDRFTGVNGAVGQHAGDDLLRQVAERLRRGADEGESVLRLGSDEFALALREASAAAATARARDLVLALAAPFEVGGRTLALTASIGVAAAGGRDGHAGTGEELLRQAESALATAVREGGADERSTVRDYDARADAAHREETALVAELRAAVAGDELTAYFQPQLGADGRLVGLEALVRWEHPVLGTVAPPAFLPLVQREGLMDALTEQVLRRALALVASWDAPGPAPRVSVNISATSLLDERLVTTVAGALVDAGVGADRLVLEVTETELMADPEASRRVLDALVALGVDVSIDDYGTGHSSLAYLKDLPVGELKLDRSFVADLGGDPRTVAIVRTTVDLAHSLGLRLVAEGVEDACTLAALLDLGVDVTQGYHHGRPMPAGQVVRWVRERPRPLGVAR